MRLTPLFALLIFSVTACDNDDNNANACASLPGEWIGTSWIEDNEQFFGDDIFITQSDFHFMPLIDGEGDMEWRIDYTFGGAETLIGTYTVNENCDQITIIPNSGLSSTYLFDINGNELTMEGNLNNVQIEMKFTRK